MSKQRRRRRREADLRKVYARIPEVHCKGWCANQEAMNVCSVVTLTETELEMITERVGHRAMAITDMTVCPMLKEGRCSVYDLRPAVCRLWGTVDMREMRCPFGCAPDRIPGRLHAYLSQDEACELLDDTRAIGGAPKVLGHSPHLKVRCDDVGAAVNVKMDEDAPASLVESMRRLASRGKIVW